MVLVIKDFRGKVTNGVAITVGVRWNILASLDEGIAVEILQQSKSHLHGVGALLCHFHVLSVLGLVICAELCGLKQRFLELCNLSIESINLILQGVLLGCECGDLGSCDLHLCICLIALVDCLCHARVANSLLFGLGLGISLQFRNEVFDQATHLHKMVF